MSVSIREVVWRSIISTFLIAIVILSGCLGYSATGPTTETENVCSSVSGVQFWNPGGDGWNQSTARISYTLHGSAPVLFVIKAEGEVVGTTAEGQFQGTEAAMDGKQVDLNRNLTGKVNLTLTAYADVNGDGRLNGADKACDGEDTATVNGSELEE